MTTKEKQKLKFNYDKANSYYSHIAYKVNISTRIAGQIANSEMLMNALFDTQNAEDGALSEEKLIELFAENITGFSEKKAELFINSYFETPYTEPSDEVARAIAEYINTHPQLSKESKWLTNKPTKFSLSPQQHIERNVETLDSFWEAYQEHKLPFNIALRGYWLLSPDNNERKEAITKIFTAYQTLDEQETQYNQVFLNAPEEGFDKELLRELGVIMYTPQGWAKVQTIKSIQTVYKLMEAAKHQNSNYRKEDYEMFLDRGLMEDQAIAGAKILRSKVTFLTGFGGTGKSHMLDNVLKYMNGKLYNKIEKPVYMTAISGRAVKNFMNGLTSKGVVGATMASHKFLDIRKKQLSDAKVLVIDEISMTDMNNLAYTISMARSAEKFIFVGDVAQLPAIQLDFFTKANHDNMIEPITLTKPKRQKADSGILKDSLSIRDGEMPSFSKPDSTLGNADTITEIIGQNPDADIFLVGTNNSAKEINDIKAKQFFDIVENDKRAKTLSGTFGDGTKFLVTKNSADTGLMNGDILTFVVENGVYHFEDEDGKKYEDIDEKKHGLKLGFAITIHKSQGSTIGNVVTILDSYAMASRGLVYTAVTRASNKHVLYEMQDGILQSALKKVVEYQDYDYKKVLELSVPSRFTKE